MIIGIPKEVKANETRVALIPDDVLEIVNSNIIVYIETNAGKDSGYTDQDYINAGAIICNTHEEIFTKADLIIKVKEPQLSEYDLITSKHTIFTFFHFAGVPGLEQAMLEKQCTCICYETMQDQDGNFPILAPMSQIAGQEAVNGGKKYLLQSPQQTIVTVIGAGSVGKAALERATQLGFQKVIILDKNINKVRELLSYAYNAAYSSDDTLRRCLSISHLIIGSIYTRGEGAPKIITNELLDIIPSGAVFVDVAIDQGGMTEQSFPGTLQDPVSYYKQVKLYCVPNLPARVPQKASTALSNVVAPYAKLLALNGVDEAIKQNAILRSGLHI
jgi:alanine dehydrogenase